MSSDGGTVLKDMVHSRSFILDELLGKYDKARTENITISLIEKLKKEDFQRHCNLAKIDNLEELMEDAFLLYSTDSAKKECIVLRKSKIKLMLFEEETKKLTTYFSEEGCTVGGGKMRYIFMIKKHNGAGSGGETKPKITFKECKTVNAYNKIIYEIPCGDNSRVLVKPFVFTSLPYSIYNMISIPKFLFIIVLLYASFCLNLGMHQRHFPLHHTLISFSWIYLFLILASTLGFENVWINSAMLVVFVVLGVALMQFINYQTRKTIALWINFLIFFEFYCEIVDISSSGLLVLLFELSLFTILVGLGKLMIFFRSQDKIPKGVNFDEEIIVTALLGMKITVYLFRANEPVRNPIFSIKLIGIESTLPPSEDLLEICVVYGLFLIVFFITRMIIVLYQRKAKESRNEDYEKVDSNVYDTHHIDQSMMDFESSQDYGGRDNSIDLDQSTMTVDEVNLVKI